MNIMFPGISELEWAVLNGIHDLCACRFLDAVMPFLSITSAFILWAVAAIVMMFFRRTRLLGISVAVACLAAVLVAQFALKMMFLRDRPLHYAEIIPLGYPEEHSSSFPSSHTAVAFASVSALITLDRRALPALIIAVIAGFSRLYLYAHFPSDVLFGAVIGAALGVLSAVAVRKAAAYIAAKKAPPIDSTEEP